MVQGKYLAAEAAYSRIKEEVRQRALALDEAISQSTQVWEQATGFGEGWQDLTVGGTWEKGGARNRATLAADAACCQMKQRGGGAGSWPWVDGPGAAPPPPSARVGA